MRAEGRPSVSTLATVMASGCATPWATASSNHARNCTNGSASTSASRSGRGGTAAGVGSRDGHVARLRPGHPATGAGYAPPDGLHSQRPHRGTAPQPERVRRRGRRPCQRGVPRAGRGLGRSALPSAGDGGAQGRGARARACGTCSSRTPSPTAARACRTPTTRRWPRCSGASRHRLGGHATARPRHRQHGDPAPVRHAEQQEQWLDAAARRRDPLGVRDDRARRSRARTRPTSSCASSATATSTSLNGRKWWTSGAASTRCRS